MSTKKSKGKLVKPLPQYVKDHFSLSLRLYREALLAKEGTMDMWTDIAGMINVGGIRARELKRPDLIEELNVASRALIAINERYERVGGRVAASEDEAWGITTGLNVLEESIWNNMSMEDFMRIGKMLDDESHNLEEVIRS